MSAIPLRLGGTLALASALAFPGPARADSFAFTIFKGDDPIGHDIYAISSNGEVKTVHVETKSDVKVLFISFHYRHMRTETWKGPTLESYVSDTDDDGTKHHVEAHQDGGKLVAMVDGRGRALSADAIPFTLWTRDFLKPNSPIFDIADFGLLKLAIADKGPDSLQLAGKTVPTHRFQVSGDLHWDLWYGDDGNLLKTAFKRRGFPISFVRE